MKNIKQKRGNGHECRCHHDRGGVVGCASAYYLKKARPDLRILVLEREVIGMEGHPATAAAYDSLPGIYGSPLALHCVQNQWPTLSEELGMDVEYYKKGNLRLGKPGTSENPAGAGG
jgi:sarcosine oxidase subunit beta